MKWVICRVLIRFPLVISFRLVTDLRRRCKIIQFCYVGSEGDPYIVFAEAGEIS